MITIKVTSTPLSCYGKALRTKYLGHSIKKILKAFVIGKLLHMLFPYYELLMYIRHQ